MSEMVKYSLDLAHLPLLPEWQKAQVEGLKALPELLVETSDIPPLTMAFWENAVSNPFYKPMKRVVTIRLDDDVIAWFKAQGGKYQTAINQVLRDYMMVHRR